MTDSIEQPANRLDRIEQMLLFTVTTVGEIAKQQQANTQAIAQLISAGAYTPLFVCST